MKGSHLLFVASWLILLVLGVFLLLGSFNSLRVAYLGTQDGLTQTVGLEKIQEIGGEEAVKAFKGRRATAATWAIGYALLMLVVVLGPYRRGERWAWWALLISMGLAQLLSLARSPMLATSQGLSAAALILAFTLLGLLAGAPRLFARRQATADDETR
jgi:hypothetical protein